MADVPGKFFTAVKVRTGVSPSSPGSQVGESVPPVNPPGSGLNSVGLTMPSAFTVANSPLTSNGTIGVTGAGTVGQYIRGDGSLADFPESSGGGSSVSYYLNGSVNQGTIGGVAYKELNKVPILGAGTQFSISGDGYIASFLTDAGDPNLLEIPGGNWNFETYFSASSSGGTPTFYVELYKYNGTTFTLIASSVTSPEFIAFGTTLTPYFSTLAVPTTTLALTDRLAVRYYVTHSGRTITMHTENNTLCQIITTFTTGITALNGLTAQVQNFAVGTSGTDFNIASATATHTFNLPTASATNRGALSSDDWTIFNGKQNPLTNPVTGTGSAGQVAYWTGTNSITSDADLLFDGSNLTVGGNIVLTNGANRFVRIGSASNYNYDLQTTGDDFQIIEAGASIATPRLTIKYPNGNVLINTTTDNGSGAKLQVTGSATFSSSIIATGDIRSNANYRDYQNESLMTTNGSVNEFGSSAAGTPRSVTIFAGNAAALTIGTNRAATFSSSVTITADSGAIALALRARSNDDFSQINFLNNAGSNQNGAIGLEKVGTNGGLMYFYTKPNGGSITEGARITSSGFLKASNTGTYASSTGTYHELINSVTGNNIAYLWNTSANPYGPYMRFSGAAPNNSTNYYLYFDDTSTVRFRVNSNGGISNYQANDVNLSDERTKKEIAPLESYWDKFKEIEIVKFKYKDQTHDDFNIGVIAQQVEKVAPEFVDVDGWDNKTEGNEVVSQEEPIKSIYTADLHHATIKVLQEAMAKIESMQKEIDTLKN